MNESSPLKLAVIGAGPVGLALALHAAATLTDAEITLFDARPLDKDVAGDPRTLALSLGSVQLLQRLGAWLPEHAQPIREVHVSQDAPSILAALAPRLAEPELTIRAIDEAVPMLGAVLSYGQVVAPLQSAWLEAAARAPTRLASRFGVAVTALKNVVDPAGVEIDEASGVVERFDLAVVAEGGVFSTAAKTGLVGGERRPALRRDYGQTAWVGIARFEPNATGAPARDPGVAYERFTRHGPAALLPLPGGSRWALVWCVPRDDDPVRELDDAQRLAVLGTVFGADAGRLSAVSPLKNFPLGLSAHRSLVRGRQVRIGNAAQTLHPVAGQGLNLGLRDAFALAAALRDASDRSVNAPTLDGALSRVAWQRAPDRWALIATTDFLARSFTWNAPGIDTLRGVGLAVLNKLPWAKTALARQMMFGRR